jgi:hypothetical protein
MAWTIELPGASNRVVGSDYAACLGGAKDRSVHLTYVPFTWNGQNCSSRLQYVDTH